VNFTTSQGREECENLPYAGFSADAVAVVLVHGVQSSRFDMVNETGVQLFDCSLTLDAVSGLQIVLLPDDHVEVGFEPAIDQARSHAILFEKDTQLCHFSPPASFLVPMTSYLILMIIA
jgi:hypothetical protein